MTYCQIHLKHSLGAWKDIPHVFDDFYSQDCNARIWI